jgi:antigen 43
VSNGGVLDVLSGGVVSQVLVSSGGEVSGGGLIEGSNNSVFGGVVTDVALYDADLYLVSGGTADGLLVGDGSTFFVAPHATASHEVLSGSGSYEAILDDSGSVVSAVAQSRGVVEVEAGASATDTIVESGGYDINFGSDTNAVVQAGGSAVTFGALFSETIRQPASSQTSSSAAAEPRCSRTSLSCTPEPPHLACSWRTTQSNSRTSPSRAGRP